MNGTLIGSVSETLNPPTFSSPSNMEMPSLSPMGYSPFHVNSRSLMDTVPRWNPLLSG